MTQPFEIVMPFWGSFDYLREAVQSVQAQSDPDWRLLVFDDHYPDTEPGQWVQALADPRVRYERASANHGVGGAFRVSAQSMSAPFGIIMGCDDVLLPGFVERARLLTAAYRKASVIQPGVVVINDIGEPHLPWADRLKRAIMPRSPRPTVIAGEALATSLLAGNWAYFPSLIWNADALRRYPFDDMATIVPDLKLLLDIAADGGQLVIDDEPVFLYRRHRGSVSSEGAAQGWRFDEERKLFAAEHARFRAKGWNRAARAAALHWTSRLHALSVVPSALRAGALRGALGLIRHALGVLPRSSSSEA
jgi:glycosyltransferase involved in cell wall biosynthesis